MMPPNGETMFGSIGRMDRTGPNRSGMVDCHTATYLVMPPSTSSSKRMSVASRPTWGRASQ